jgi:hypothetical protein
LSVTGSVVEAAVGAIAVRDKGVCVEMGLEGVIDVAAGVVKVEVCVGCGWLSAVQPLIKVNTLRSMKAKGIRFIVPPPQPIITKKDLDIAPICPRLINEGNVFPIGE